MEADADGGDDGCDEGDETKKKKETILARSLTQALTHSLTQALMHSLTHSLTHLEHNPIVLFHASLFVKLVCVLSQSRPGHVVDALFLKLVLLSPRLQEGQGYEHRHSFKTRRQMDRRSEQ